MLKLRKVLLWNKFYYILLFIVFVISFIRLSIPKKSIYSESSHCMIGVITNLSFQDEKVTVSIKNRETIIGTIYKRQKNDYSNIRLGDKIKACGTFSKPSSNTMDYLFNYQEYLYNKNIFFLLKIKYLKKIRTNHNIYYFFKQNFRNRLHQDSYLHTFLLGDKSYLSDSIKRSYQENGISHLFAISGMHITLLVQLIEKIFKKFHFNEITMFKVTSIILFLYLLLVGFSPSILRGVLFYYIFSLNNIYYTYIKPINLFLVVLSFSLLINPYYIFDVGFQYSYFISFSLIMLSDYLKSNHYFVSLLKVSFVSFISSIPITLYHFYQINILSIFYNLFFVPLVSIVIFPMSLFVFIFIPFKVIYHLFLSILEKSSLFFSHISIGKVLFIRLPFFVYFLYFLFVLFFLVSKKKLFLVILFVFLVLHFFYPMFDNTNYLQVIDVGQGDSLLFHVNNKNILMDTGGFRSFYKNIDGIVFYNTTMPFLRSRAVSKIDYLILSHGDFDHMGEAINLVNNFKVENVIFNCGEYNDLEKELIKVLDRKHIQYYSCIKELNIDKNKLYFLQTKEYDNENDNSNVIYTEIDGYKFMFMGDASITTEKEIINKYNLPDIDVLKVGHHGSKTSSGKEFINETNPKYSVISVGKNNRYGHPNKEVINNLKDSKIYRTDEDGSVMFKIKNNKLKIETCSP